MTKVSPIPEELWGAINIVTQHIDLSFALTNASNPKLQQASSLLREYSACFGADGRVSQRGEIPQCWNPHTIFTPHREVGKDEVFHEQPLLPLEEKNNDEDTK